MPNTALTATEHIRGIPDRSMEGIDRTQGQEERHEQDNAEQGRIDWRFCRHSGASRDPCLGGRAPSEVRTD